MYKNDRFIKEYNKGNSPYEKLAHGPILIDDFIGDAIIKSGDFKQKQAEEITEALNLVAVYGFAKMPKRAIRIALKMMLLHHMKPTEAVVLLNKYIGDWGGTSTVYRFEAIKDGKVIKTITKEPMTQMRLEAKADHTYDVAAVRIRVVDENDNQLNFFNEPVVLRTEGPIEIIGDSVVSLKGGMVGTYLKTTGEAGSVALYMKTAQAEEVKIEFSVNVATNENVM